MVNRKTATGEPEGSQGRLSCAQINEAPCEECGKRVEEPILASCISSDEMQDGPGDDAEAESIGDGVGERDQYECEEGWYGDQRLVPADLSDGGEHHGSD